ncbi:uncharacterized protein SPSK_10407 [Sporothrix schenckii 1099-18]|uniref:EGF domain-specific O-linked N-acetylglucosamine transferase n=1 Tax=Sporothrix schenckii 1099-18 TaxID=1397361 RepID=A0A0F2MCT5_SPOSC|nr:uncharacterized protein SPSK_10407 [Sporothrix schenckii 1099-18]KJR87493.1 hypothetical protein SPSK_10407 [Sporothrix schenckii 1099-18]
MMLLRRCSPILPLRRRAVYIPLALLLTLAVFTFWDPARGPCCSGLPGLPAWLPSPAPLSAVPLDVLSIPELDEPSILPPPKHDGFCTQRFTTAYLEDLRDHSIQYCDPVGGTLPRSRLTCFHAHVRDDKGVDSFCLGTSATWDAGQKTFRLDCPIRRRPDANETARGLIPFESIAASWFDTGPRRVFDKFVSLSHDEASPEQQVLETSTPRETKSFVLLVKREGNNNLWHSLMEIWSMMMSVDVLRIAQQQDDGRADGAAAPYFRFPDDLDNTHVVMLDEYAEESTFDLWRFFSRHPIVKLADMMNDPSRVPRPLQPASGGANIIVPLSGGSNPLWQNDWVVRDCRAAPLLQLFVRRVFEHYQVPRQGGPRPASAGGASDKDIVVTFIDRRGSRQLLGHAALLHTLQERYPNVVVQSVDFATLSLPDQLRLVQETDVLVGVHGAGLTHTMFMRENAGAVVEVQPANLGHKGFRNLAALTGHNYFSAQAEMAVPGEDEEEGDKNENGENKTSIARRGDPEKPWQSSHVRIEEDRFLALMDVAIKSLYNEGLRNHDVI